MCTNNCSNRERYDKVIAKIKWCSFFCLTVYVPKCTEVVKLVKFLQAVFKILCSQAVSDLICSRHDLDLQNLIISLVVFCFNNATNTQINHACLSVITMPSLPRSNSVK